MAGTLSQGRFLELFTLSRKPCCETRSSFQGWSFFWVISFSGCFIVIFKDSEVVQLFPSGFSVGKELQLTVPTFPVTVQGHLPLLHHFPQVLEFFMMLQFLLFIKPLQLFGRHLREGSHLPLLLLLPLPQALLKRVTPVLWSCLATSLTYPCQTQRSGKLFQLAPRWFMSLQ